MKVLARKTSMKSLLTVKFLFCAILMAAVVIALPVCIFSQSPELLTELSVWVVVLILMVLFALAGIFGGIRPFLLFRRLPEVQAETDGTYLYIHSKKEAKIPLAEMEGTYLDAELPYMLSKEFIVHLLSERYGKVIIKVPGYGKYRLYYISGADAVPGIILDHIMSKI